MPLRSTTTAIAGLVVLLALAGCTSALVPNGPGGQSVSTPSGEIGVADGYIAPGDSILLTDDVPAITNLAPDLRDALDRAAADAANRGVVFTITSGWRSERYQNHLFDEAVVKYASEAEAERWVKRGADSKHVTGEAVDIATADAMDWLTRFGAPYGLCQTYTNESWHYELVPDAVVAGVCPPQLTDSSEG